MRTYQNTSELFQLSHFYIEKPSILSLTILMSIYFLTQMHVYNLNLQMQKGYLTKSTSFIYLYYLKTIVKYSTIE